MRDKKKRAKKKMDIKFLVGNSDNAFAFNNDYYYYFFFQKMLGEVG